MMSIHIRGRNNPKKTCNASWEAISVPTTITIFFTERGKEPLYSNPLRSLSKTNYLMEFLRMRTCYTGRVCRSHLGQTVTLYGWVNRRRDHGGVIFIDLRDRTGLTQIVFSPGSVAFPIGECLRNEYCICLTGIVRLRPEKTVNKELDSGEVEVLCEKVKILNTSLAPPFHNNDNDLSETTRLVYRVLDLRRPKMQHNLWVRHCVSSETRKYLDHLGFIDIETPMLTRSTPEGARDYLIPSRIHSGCFFALPQSPQLFKQVLMVSGFDRYYQITKCFRDEDLRADRQPEFTQIDCEISFLQEKDIRKIFEDMIVHIFKVVRSIELETPFPVITYAEAIKRYGSDKPDLRVKLEITNVTDLMQDVGFKVFSIAANKKDGQVLGMRIPKGKNFSRSEIEAFTAFTSNYGVQGLSYIKINKVSKGRQGMQSPIVKNLSDAILSKIVDRTGARDGDIIFFLAGHKKTVNSAMGRLRLKIGYSNFARDAELFTAGWKPLWVTEFPMFEYSVEENRYVATHHPFTSPKDDSEKLLDHNPELVLSKSYDMILNGCEIGGGSIRIHNVELQKKIFRILEIDEETERRDFGFLLDALKYGAPPHGGIAFGLDRIVAIMVGADSIRDVIAFPKTQRAQCLLTQSPSSLRKDSKRIVDATNKRS